MSNINLSNFETGDSSFRDLYVYRKLYYDFDNDEVTVKTLIKISDSQVILRPENSSYSDIEVNPKKDNLIFEGTCVGLLRDFS